MSTPKGVPNKVFFVTSFQHLATKKRGCDLSKRFFWKKKKKKKKEKKAQNCHILKKKEWNFIDSKHKFL
jgi:hypothetical protein